MGNVSSHTYTYAGKRSFACNCEENNGKCGLAPPNNRFERTHGTSPFAAQPNVRWTLSREEKMKLLFYILSVLIFALTYILIRNFCKKEISYRKKKIETIVGEHQIKVFIKRRNNRTFFIFIIFLASTFILLSIFYSLMKILL